MDFIQNLLDSMSSASRVTRADYHVTLGKLITALEAAPQDGRVVYDDGAHGPCCPHSYRGYYSDLAFDAGTPPKVADFLAMCRGALGDVFTGYKGGDFVMDEATPLWRSEHGASSGIAIVATVPHSAGVSLTTRQLDT